MRLKQQDEVKSGIQRQLQSNSLFKLKKRYWAAELGYIIFVNNELTSKLKR